MRTGFSLIELMVVIAIVGILAGISVPTYKSYVYYAKLANTVNLLGNVKDQLIMQYDSGRSLASSLSYNNISLPSATNVSVTNMGNIGFLAYYAPGTGVTGRSLGSNEFLLVAGSISGIARLSSQRM